MVMGLLSVGPPDKRLADDPFSLNYSLIRWFNEHCKSLICSLTQSGSVKFIVMDAFLQTLDI